MMGPRRPLAGAVLGTVCLCGLSACTLFVDTSGLAAQDGTTQDPDGAATYFSLYDATKWESFSVDAVDGGAGARFHSGASTAEHVIVIPGEDGSGQYGDAVLLYKRQLPFTDPSSWRWLATGHVLGATPHGSYVYCPPGWSSTIFRWNDSDASAPIETFDVLTNWLTRAVAAGNNVYFFPRRNPNIATGGTRAFRFDTVRAFTDPFGWTSVDLTPLGSEAPIRSAVLIANGAIFAFPSIGCALFRYDVSGPFADLGAAWSTLSSPYCTAADGSGTFRSHAYDGQQYAYVPLAGGLLADGGAAPTRLVVRFDTKNPTDPGAWTAMDLDLVMASLDVPRASVFDGRYVFVLTSSALLYRYDTTLPFKDAESWTGVAVTSVIGGLDYGAEGLVFDGEFVYVLPDSSHTSVLRFHARTPPATLP